MRDILGHRICQNTIFILSYLHKILNSINFLDIHRASLDYSWQNNTCGLIGGLSMQGFQGPIILEIWPENICTNQEVLDIFSITLWYLQGQCIPRNCNWDQFVCKISSSKLVITQGTERIRCQPCILPGVYLWYSICPQVTPTFPCGQPQHKTNKQTHIQIFKIFKEF